MTQQTNPNPPLHQTVIDLVNENATDAETRLTELEEGESSVIQTLFSGSAGKDEMVRWTPDISTFGEVTVEGYWENTAGVSWRGAITISTAQFLSLAPANSYFQLSSYTEADTSDSALIGFRETFENGFRVVGFGTYGDNVMVTRVTAKRYTSIIEIPDVSGGQAWSTPADGEPIEPGKGFFSANAGDTFPVRDTMKDISFIVTDGSNSASADNPVTLEIDSALGYTFADGTTTFEIDLAGASVEFALINGVWELVNTGNIIFGGGAETVVTLWNGLREYGGDTSDVTFSEDITAFDEISLDWAIGGGGGVQRTGTTSLSSTKIAEMIATGGTDLRWLAEVWTQAVDLTNESERIEVGLTTLTATTATPYFSFAGANANKTPQITRVRGKKATTLNQELTETANTWIEPQTFAKPITGTTGIKHNFASFRVNSSVGIGDDCLFAGQELPAGWAITKTAVGEYSLTYGQTFAITPQPIPQSVNNYTAYAWTNGVNEVGCNFYVTTIGTTTKVDNNISVQVAF